MHQAYNSCNKVDVKKFLVLIFICFLLSTNLTFFAITELVFAKINMETRVKKVREEKVFFVEYILVFIIYSLATEDL